MNFIIGSATILLGLIIIVFGYGSLFYALKTYEKKGEANLSLTAIKAAYILVVAGLLIIMLGLLYLMGIIPWYWASKCDDLTYILI